ncbi:GGDEF domain-containing protein [Shewanella psychrotolerans]|uniref:GGDEF domain-containing protein n=1 Tax=Shewanella psychrotolerans TaxID=2864206 RepID=UPI001C65564C|nr:GGDEF domain-containing protein [Shewanella psychrotolerans]QYJ99958.1 GGDEF domain-containing protein [Shewanella psychrotolerans]
MAAKLHLQDIEAKYLKIVSEFAIDMLSLQGIDNILWHLAQNVVAQLGFDDVVIYLLDEKRQVLVQKASFGAKNPKDHEILTPIELKVGEGIVGQVAETQRPILIGDTRLCDNYIVDDAPRLSELAVPMLVEGEVVGVIDSEHPKKDFYNKQHERTVFALASITALKIHKAKTLVKLQHTIVELEYSSKIQDTLFEIAEIIFETDNISTFYRRLHQCLARLTFAKNFYVAILDDGASVLRFPYHVDQFDKIEQGSTIAIDPMLLSINDYVLLKNKPLLADEAQLKAMVEAGDIHINGRVPNAWLGIPFAGDQYKGIVVVQSYLDSYQFHQNDKQLLIFVAKHIRNAIERMKVKSRMEFLALYDPLTDLPNRTLFVDRLTKAQQSLSSDRFQGIALLYIDIDNFKAINDTYGLHLGDELLKGIALRLREAITEQDTLCRFSGDEFAILLEQIDTPQKSHEVGHKLLELLDDVIDLGGIRIAVSARVGIVNCFQATRSISQILSQADEAMYNAKLLERNSVYVYEADTTEGQCLAYELEAQFERAVTRQELYLEYQPIYDLSSEAIVGAESLIRWSHPQLGKLAPSRFLPELQREGLLERLDIYVVQQAMAFVSVNQAQLPEGFKLSVNISVTGFNSAHLLALFEEQYLLHPQIMSQLCIEITEQTLVNSVNETKLTIARLREMGLSVSLDDFGTGHSSLSYLHQFTFDLLKIDRAFISHMDMLNDNRVVLETIINLAKTLNIKTVAEGIETQEQFMNMQQLDCDFAQGYFMSSSLSGARLLNILNDRRSYSCVD